MSSIIEPLARSGITHFFIAPGSRSTLLTLSAVNHPKTVTDIHFDERALGFMALGYGKALKKPAAVIVTSGSATVNLLPALVEAYESRTPLIILTADRPEEFKDLQHNQTLEQIAPFSPYVLWQKNLSLSDTSPLALSRFAAYGATRAMKGPIHFNIQIKEPFFNQPNHPTPPPVYYNNSEVSGITPIELKPKTLILIGENPPEHAKSVIENIQAPVISDLLSGFRNHPYSVTHSDFLFRAQKIEPPDCVLHFGGKMISKFPFLWLKNHPPKKYCHISADERLFDPYHLITDVIKGPVSLEGSSKAYFKSIPKLRNFSLKEEPYFFNQLQDRNEAFFIGNSSVIRDADQFFYPQKPSKIFANRGVSGIDGNVATSVGIVKALKKPLISIIGDLTLLHDLNSLTLMCNLPLCLIVFNNYGGGIFHRLPIKNQTPHFAKYFACQHGFSFSEIAKSFNMRYQDHLKSISFDGPSLIEIKTCAEKNINTLARLDGIAQRL